MNTKDHGDAAAEVAAMQFAGGMAISDVAAEWERDVEWVEAAVRRALLQSIPRRDGGLKASRTEMRAERHGMRQAVEGMQGKLRW